MNTGSRNDRKQSNFRRGLERITARAGELAFALSLVVTCLSVPDSVFALNGYTHVSLCACTTTADFTNAALAAASDQNGFQYQPGTYTVASTSAARTAQIKIAQTVNRSGTYIYTTTPVDASGNSLGGESESVLETYYGTFDQVTFGANRDAPQFGASSAYFPASFINTTDVQMSSAIDAWLESLHIAVGLPATITITFADGTTAEFKGNATGLPWTWNGIAHNKKGQLINRNGTVRANPNTSGSGGGQGMAPGFGYGAGWGWLIGGGNNCALTVTVDLGDGPVQVGGGWVPC